LKFTNNINENNLSNQIYKGNIKKNNKKKKREKLSILLIEKYTRMFNAINNIDVVEKHVLDLTSKENIIESDINFFEENLRADLNEINRKSNSHKTDLRNLKGMKEPCNLLKVTTNIDIFLQKFKLKNNTKKINSKKNLDNVNNILNFKNVEENKKLSFNSIVNNPKKNISTLNSYKNTSNYIDYEVEKSFKDINLNKVHVKSSKGRNNNNNNMNQINSNNTITNSLMFNNNFEKNQIKKMNEKENSIGKFRIIG